MFHLPWSKPATARPACCPEVLADAVTAASTTDGEATPLGCGWFDSSHDLLHGLQVQEHTQPESLADILPLSAWLDLQLTGWRSQPRMQLTLA